MSVVTDLMLLAILVRFLLIRVREIAHGIDLLDMLDAREELVEAAPATACFIRVLGLLITRGGIAGSWCASET